jgi:hypothetical protein
LTGGRHCCSPNSLNEIEGVTLPRFPPLKKPASADQNELKIFSIPFDIVASCGAKLTFVLEPTPTCPETF